MPRPRTLPVWTIFAADQAVTLRRPADPIGLNDITTPAMQRLAADMRQTMHHAEGIGLAAPQVGQSIRLMVIAKEVDPQLREDIIVINPTIQKTGPTPISMEEGCLSIPGVFGNVDRPATVTVQAFDAHGHPVTINAAGLLARVLQHEIDHLNGVLFIDRTKDFTRGQELL